MTADNPQIPRPKQAQGAADDFLAAYRESQAIPEAVKARVRQRLLVAGAPAPEPAPAPLDQLDPLDPLDPLDQLDQLGPLDPLDQAQRRRSFYVDQRWWIAAAAIILLSAAIALLSDQQEGIVASRSGVDGAAYTADSRATRGNARSRGGDRRIDEPTPLPTTLPSPRSDDTTPGEPSPTTSSPRPVVPTDLPEIAATTSRRPTTNARAPQREPTTAPTLDLTGEKSLLEGAWRALAAGEHGAARDSLRRHHRDFADGVLRQEREVLEVLLACTTGASGGAEQAARFHRQHPQSPWTDRIDDVCPAYASPR